MELKKTEYAAIKRINNTVKVLKSKKASIQTKIDALIAETLRIEKEIDNWEQPVKNLTGGFTSDQVLDGTWRLIPKEENVEYYTEEDINNY